MELLWTIEAIESRGTIYDYIEASNPAAAESFDALLHEKARQLADDPGLGRPGRVAGTRELVVHPNYVLVYEVTGDAVRVLAVVHAARRWPAD
ncbi:type II toxin-antitoxin system RelE/ParE family toxin [Stella sp.]|uniref:type II toxin-antitoxin system RelE/ParE family toxin n=1 Tax=Stella sp. TaxID=2912054 RepID=UPI0035ADC0DF